MKNTVFSFFVEIILEHFRFGAEASRAPFIYKSRAQLPTFLFCASFLCYFPQTLLYMLPRLIPTFDTFLTRVHGQAARRSQPPAILGIAACGIFTGAAGAPPKMLKSCSCQVLRYNATREEDALSCYTSYAVAQPPSPFTRW